MLGAVVDMTRSFHSTLCILILAAGCKAENASSPSEKTPPTQTEVKPATPPAGPAASNLAAGILIGEKGGVRVSELKGSPKFPAARLAQSAPADDAKLAPGKVAFSYEVLNYELTAQTVANPPLANSGQGQHIHFIVDNGPYLAQYAPNFEVELTEGHHVILAFLSRSYHEAVKSDGAAVVKVVTVGEPSEPKPDLSGPTLFYSRPKGAYEATDHKMLLLDFYLLNTTLSEDGNKVRALINGNEFVLSKWVPYVIEGLPAGELTIELELIDKDGKPIPGPFNKVKRMVELK